MLERAPTRVEIDINAKDICSNTEGFIGKEEICKRKKTIVSPNARICRN